MSTLHPYELVHAGVKLGAMAYWRSGDEPGLVFAALDLSFWEFLV